MDQEFGNGLIWWLEPIISYEITVKMPDGGSSHLDGLSGAGGFTFKVTHSHTWQVNTSCFQDTIVLCHKNTFIGIFECSAGMEACFLQNK